MSFPIFSLSSFFFQSSRVIHFSQYAKETKPAKVKSHEDVTSCCCCIHSSWPNGYFLDTQDCHLRWSSSQWSYLDVIMSWWTSTAVLYSPSKPSIPRRVLGSMTNPGIDQSLCELILQVWLQHKQKIFLYFLMSSCHHSKSLKFYPQVFHFSFLLHFDTFVLSNRCKSRNFHIWIDAAFPHTLDFDTKLQVPPLSKPFRWECRQSDRCLFMPIVCMMVYRFRYNFAPSKVTVILPRPSIAWQSTKTFASFPFGIYIYSTSFAFCEDCIFQPT